MGPLAGASHWPMPSPLSCFVVWRLGEDGLASSGRPFLAPLLAITEHKHTAIRAPFDAILIMQSGLCCFGRGRGRTIIIDKFLFLAQAFMLAADLRILPLPEKPETIAVVVACWFAVLVYIDCCLGQCRC